MRTYIENLTVSIYTEFDGDKKNWSFIAGLQRSAFDNKTVSFEEHTKLEHNMWHYLNFIVLVKVKKSTEFTGPESYVSEMVQVIA